MIIIHCLTLPFYSIDLSGLGISFSETFITRFKFIRSLAIKVKIYGKAARPEWFKNAVRSSVLYYKDKASTLDFYETSIFVILNFTSEKVVLNLAPLYGFGPGNNPMLLLKNSGSKLSYILDDTSTQLFIF